MTDRTYVVHYTPMNESLEAGKFEFTTTRPGFLPDPSYLQSNFMMLLTEATGAKYVLEDDSCVIRCIAWCEGIDGTIGFVMENTDHSEGTVDTFAGTLSPADPANQKHDLKG